VLRFLAGGCLFRILFLVLALVVLALYIKHQGPVM